MVGDVSKGNEYEAQEAQDDFDGRRRAETRCAKASPIGRETDDREGLRSLVCFVPGADTSRGNEYEAQPGMPLGLFLKPKGGSRE